MTLEKLKKAVKKRLRKTQKGRVKTETKNKGHRRHLRKRTGKMVMGRKAGGSRKKK